MADSAPPTTRCHLALGVDPARCGLVVDYPGDRPPDALFERLRQAGWSTPAPVPPPADALDWSTPDPVTGRRWSVRPFVVTGAMAVPGPAVSQESCSPGWLTSVVRAVGFELEVDARHVGLLTQTVPGRAEVVIDVTDPGGDDRELDLRPSRRAPSAASVRATAGFPRLEPAAAHGSPARSRGITSVATRGSAPRSARTQAVPARSAPLAARSVAPPAVPVPAARAHQPVAVPAGHGSAGTASPLEWRPPA